MAPVVPSANVYTRVIRVIPSENKFISTIVLVNSWMDQEPLAGTQVESNEYDPQIVVGLTIQADIKFVDGVVWRTDGITLNPEPPEHYIWARRFTLTYLNPGNNGERFTMIVDSGVLFDGQKLPFNAAGFGGVGILINLFVGESAEKSFCFINGPAAGDDNLAYNYSTIFFADVFDAVSQDFSFNVSDNFNLLAQTLSSIPVGQQISSGITLPFLLRENVKP